MRGGAAAWRWQGQCQGIGIGASVLQWQSGIGGGGALAAALMPPLMLMLRLICVDPLGWSRSAHFARRASGLMARAACLRPQANIGGGGSGTWLALLGLSRGQAANALMCAARLRPRENVRDDSGPLFAMYALLGLRCGCRQWRLVGTRQCNGQCYWGEAVRGVDHAMDDAIAGCSVGEVEGQGMDDAVFDRGI
jgi:hypothetical protein